MRQSVGEVEAALPQPQTQPPAPTKKRSAGLAIGATAAVVVIGGLLLMKSHSTSQAPVAATPSPPAVAATAPAPSPPTPTLPTTGRLQLHIEGGPADRISLDGREIARATSAVDFGEVSPGAHLVAIEAAGRDTQQSPVTVTAGAPTMLSVALKPRSVQPPSHAGARRPSSLHPAGLVEDAASGKPAASEARPPVTKHSRAEEHGLMDENPFRKQ